MKACQKLEKHVFIIELDHDVCIELLQPLVDVVEDQIDAMEEENNDPNVHF